MGGGWRADALLMVLLGCVVAKNWGCSIFLSSEASTAQGWADGNRAMLLASCVRMSGRGGGRTLKPLNRRMMKSLKLRLTWLPGP